MIGERETLNKFGAEKADELIGLVRKEYGDTSPSHLIVKTMRETLIQFYVSGAEDMLDAIEAAKEMVTTKFAHGQLEAAIAAKLSAR